MSRFARSALLGLLAVLLTQPPAEAEKLVGTLTLDAFSYVSFQDEEILAFPSGSTIRFHFGEPAADGTIPFTVAPEDVSIGPIALSSGTLEYVLAAPASGTMRSTADGRRIEFTASVAATRDSPDGGGTLTYTIHFSTESASSPNADGTRSVSVSGMRMVEGPKHVQIVGATVNRGDAFPKPSAAVYTVLSGQFDQVPATP